MRNCSSANKCSYLRTPMGAVKLANVVLGAISLVLVAVSYEPVWTLAVFTASVSVCLGLSSIYLLFYVVASTRFVQSKANRVTSFIYHVLAGIALIVAGIELIGWSDYDSKCKRNCPHLYTVGIAKTLTFMNGTLYLIVAFLGIKDDDFIDPDAADDDIPLVGSQDILTGIPGKVMSSSGVHRIHSPPSILYNSYQDRHKAPYYDDVKAHYYYSRQHQSQSYRDRQIHRQTEEFLTNSYGSLGQYSGIHFVAEGNGGGGHDRRQRTGSMSSNRSAHSISFLPGPAPPTSVSPDLDLIQE